MRHRRRPVCPWSPSLSDSRQCESEMLSEAIIPEWGNRSCWRLRGRMVVSSSCMIEPHTFFTNHSWWLIHSLLDSCPTISELKNFKCFSAKSLWEQSLTHFLLSLQNILLVWREGEEDKVHCSAIRRLCDESLSETGHRRGNLSYQIRWVSLWVQWRGGGSVPVLSPSPVSRFVTTWILQYHPIQS